MRSMNGEVPRKRREFIGDGRLMSNVIPVRRQIPINAGSLATRRPSCARENRLRRHLLGLRPCQACLEDTRSIS